VVGGIGSKERFIGKVICAMLGGGGGGGGSWIQYFSLHAVASYLAQGPHNIAHPR